MSTKRVLSIQSHVVSGYVGNKSAVFPLQVLGYEVDFINSVQFSNHTGYGQWKGQVLNDVDLDDLFQGLKMNNLTVYDSLLTGYVGSESFLRKICQVVKDIKFNNPNCVYLCDPVLGDDGHFYVPPSLVPIYVNEVLPLADIITPNTFEIQNLSGMTVRTESDVLEATQILHDKGVATVVLSSLDFAKEIATYVSHRKGCGRQVWKVITPKISGKFTGSGDLFSALFLGWYSKMNQDLPKALTATLTSMGKVLQRTYEYSKIVPSTSKAPTELQLVQSLDDIRSPCVNLEAVTVPIRSACLK
ncbi:unnamed protein product [Allacma fusca]|uniref:Pyridoxal kinase n=1 Tax=Allacma fusca TaxID=39272 RepID=A0A8J2LBJ2_9HEXA|nr:unnamed protein product [Allacma fusca]